MKYTLLYGLLAATGPCLLNNVLHRAVFAVQLILSFVNLCRRLDKTALILLIFRDLVAQKCHRRLVLRIQAFTVLRKKRSCCR